MRRTRTMETMTRRAEELCTVHSVVLMQEFSCSSVLELGTSVPVMVLFCRSVFTDAGTLGSLHTMFKTTKQLVGK